jgi:hypothetical protein
VNDQINYPTLTDEQLLDACYGVLSQGECDIKHWRNIAYELQRSGLLAPGHAGENRVGRLMRREARVLKQQSRFTCLLQGCFIATSVHRQSPERMELMRQVHELQLSFNRAVDLFNGLGSQARARSVIKFVLLLCEKQKELDDLDYPRQFPRLPGLKSSLPMSPELQGMSVKELQDKLNQVQCEAR